MQKLKPSSITVAAPFRCSTMQVQILRDVVQKEWIDKSVDEKLDKLAVYYSGNYIGNTFVNQKPSFPTKKWNQYDAAGEWVDWTANSVESRHYGLQAFLSGSTPNIWFLLRNLEKNWKCRSLNIFNKLPVYCAPNAPVTRKPKKADGNYLTRLRIRQCSTMS